MTHRTTLFKIITIVLSIFTISVIRYLSQDKVIGETTSRIVHLFSNVLPDVRSIANMENGENNFTQSRDTTLSNLLEKNNLFDHSRPPAVSKGKMMNHPLMDACQNLVLWSKQPEAIDLTKTIEMCQSILNNQSIDDAKSWQLPYPHDDASMANLVSNCSNFRATVPFPTSPASEEEADFSLAYVFVGQRNAAQSVRLFRAIYQPQNAYCITYDTKSTQDYKNTITRLAYCFSGDENVFLNPSPEPIYYADYSILRNEMACLRILLQHWERIPWKYVQIVSWNDFPLKTNLEMVRIFKILNGSQDSALVRRAPEFYTKNFRLRPSQDADLEKIPRTIPPDGLTMYKGSHATSMTKEFLDFLFNNPTSLRLYEWLDGASCPEEQYWPTIIHNVQLGAPGSFPGECYEFFEERNYSKPFVSRYDVWERDDCKGRFAHYSCLFGVFDIPSLIKRPELMAHKIYEEFQTATSFCLDHWYWTNVCNLTNRFDFEYYEKFPSVRYQKLQNKNDFVC